MTTKKIKLFWVNNEHWILPGIAIAIFGIISAVCWFTFFKTIFQ